MDKEHSAPFGQRIAEHHAARHIVLTGHHLGDNFRSVRQRYGTSVEIPNRRIVISAAREHAED